MVPRYWKYVCRNFLYALLFVASQENAQNPKIKNTLKYVRITISTFVFNFSIEMSSCWRPKGGYLPNEILDFISLCSEVGFLWKIRF